MQLHEFREIAAKAGFPNVTNEQFSECETEYMLTGLYDKFEFVPLWLRRKERFVFLLIRNHRSVTHIFSDKAQCVSWLNGAFGAKIRKNCRREELTPVLTLHLGGDVCWPGEWQWGMTESELISVSDEIIYLPQEKERYERDIRKAS